MKKEIDPKESPRGRAFELWKTAGMPKVTIVKTFDVSRLVRVAKRNGMKTKIRFATPADSRNHFDEAVLTDFYQLLKIPVSFNFHHLIPKLCHYWQLLVMQK